jgi:hypothetical protein
MEREMYSAAGGGRGGARTWGREIWSNPTSANRTPAKRWGLAAASSLEGGMVWFGGRNGLV